MFSVQSSGGMVLPALNPLNAEHWTLVPLIECNTQSIGDTGVRCLGAWSFIRAPPLATSSGLIIFLLDSYKDGMISETVLKKIGRSNRQIFSFNPSENRILIEVSTKPRSHSKSGALYLYPDSVEVFSFLRWHNYKMADTNWMTIHF